MKKSDIVEHVSREGATTKRAAEAAVDAVFAAIAESLAGGEDVTVAGFGRFSIKARRRARAGTRALAGLSPSARR